MPRNEQVCRNCGVVKPRTANHFRASPDGRIARTCLACDAVLKGMKHAMKKYGVTREEYASLTLRACALCGSTKRLTIDHCHKRGYVRDRLCTPCNTGLGMFKDRPDVLRKAADYIEEHAFKHCEIEWEKIKSEYP